MSQVLSSPPTTINQTLLTNNKRAISQYFGTVALTTQPRFYLFKVNDRNTKNTRARCGMCLKLTVKTPDFTHSSGVSIGKFEQVNADSVDELQNKIYFKPEH